MIRILTLGLVGLGSSTSVGALFLGTLILGGLFPAEAGAQEAAEAAATASAAQAAAGETSPESMERGRYIVEHLAMCVQCHTPRDGEGNLDRSRWLQGAPVPVGSPYWTENWALGAPAIYGFVGYQRDEAIRLLTTGYNRNDRMPRSPMPPFRMTEADATAVVDFLMSTRK